MSTSHRLAAAGSLMRSQRRAAHTTNAVNSDDKAYTSPSTAENQNESEKAYDREPTTRAASTPKVWAGWSPVSAAGASLRASSVIVQNRNRRAKALKRAEEMLIQ